MDKETFFFSHDYNARNDLKSSALISEYGATGYGIYWYLIEMLHEEPTHKLPLKEYFYRTVAKQVSTNVEQVLNIIQDCLNLFELFKEKDGYFYSERVLRNMEKRADIREKRSLAGKASAFKRKNSTSVEQVSTSVEQNLTNGQQRSTNKRKRKESKVKEISNIINDELSILDEPDKQRWNKFQEWVQSEKIQNILKIENQLTPNQLVKLFKTYGAQGIKDTLLALENHKNVSKYNSVYLTLNNWLKKTLTPA